MRIVWWSAGDRGLTGAYLKEKVYTHAHTHKCNFKDEKADTKEYMIYNSIYKNKNKHNQSMVLKFRKFDSFELFLEGRIKEASKVLIMLCPGCILMNLFNL